VQAPWGSTQQYPALALPHVLETHTPPGGQVVQVPLQLVCPDGQQTPLEQLPEQQSPFPLQVPPLAVQGVTHWPFWQTWPEVQQVALL